MAYQRMELSLVLVLVTMLWAGAMAQSNDCTNTIISMSPCLNYITGNSSTPSSGCCTQLAKVVSSSPECLCQVLNGGGASLGLNINQTQALALPSACKVQTPSISRCNAASPANSPTESTNSPSDIPSGSGSKTVPTTDDGTSDGSSSKLSASLLFFLLFAASYASAFTSC